MIMRVKRYLEAASPTQSGKCIQQVLSATKNLCKIISQLLNCGQVLPFLVINHSRGHNSQNSTTKNCIKLLFPHICIITSQQGRGGGACYIQYRPSATFRNIVLMKYSVHSLRTYSWQLLMRNNEYG